MRAFAVREVVESKKLFEPGDLVTTFSGDIGFVLTREELQEVRGHSKEGNRPGRYFSPGCCQNPDYLTQIPVFFEDGTHDVMRSMNLRKIKDPSGEKGAEIKKKMASLLPR